MTITDAHVHIRDASQTAHFAALADELGLSSIGLVCTEREDGGHDNLNGFVAKKRRPDFYYLFAGLDHHDDKGQEVDGDEPARQIDRLVDAGVDGIKLIESKPATRRKIGHALDGEYYAGAFEQIARHDLPLVWHVADPEEFWDPSAIPSWAAEKGWGYDDTVATKEALYAEAFAVLRRHPSLRVIFAHFFFLSADLDRAASLLEMYPGVCLDLAPGVEMLYNFSRDLRRSREFFHAYADRIVYGTDLGIFPDESLATSKARAELVLRFLRGDEQYRVPGEADFLLGPPEDGVIRGIALDDEALTKILGANYRAIAGPEPRPLNLPAATAECERYAQRLGLVGTAERASEARSIIRELSG